MPALHSQKKKDKEDKDSVSITTINENLKEINEENTIAHNNIRNRKKNLENEVACNKNVHLQKKQKNDDSEHGTPEKTMHVSFVLPQELTKILKVPEKPLSLDDTDDSLFNDDSFSIDKADFLLTQ